MAHFTIFFKNEGWLRLDHWDGDLKSLPGIPEDINRIVLCFEDGSSIDFTPEVIR